jgi:hypothetical protein
MMSQETSEMLQEWNQTAYQYSKIQNTGARELVRALFNKMVELAKRLHERDIPLGLPPNEARYIQESLKSIMSNPTSQMSRAVILEIPAILNRYLSPEDEQKCTLRGFNEFVVNGDGSLSLPEKTEEPQPKLPDHPATRNADLEKWRGEKKNGN